MPESTAARPPRQRHAAAPRKPVAATPVGEVRFPEDLPVSLRREDIARALREHQVVIVCGETGSGKTTQLPKIALSIGRGLGAGGTGLIGHTQPRRLAATSIAKRVAQELGSELGAIAGYKVRFNDRLQPGASIKLMTDGILLAETQTDPLLRAYDTLIIDEAHERSLNIDVLLGYLKQLLPRRPDLKVIVTSATIDAQRFAEHFAESAPRPAPGRPKPGGAPSGGSDGAQPGAWGQSTLAPVIEVSGRLYPVEVRWRPFGVDKGDDRDQSAAICDAVDELWRLGSGDILVFLPGEREIREAEAALRKHHLDTKRVGVEILPLYARLSQAEQDRVFASGGARRIVLATNVAETSLTVPGIRYVIDAGLARVKRYSYRNKVEMLQVESISQAAAQQRAGRCGRVANGVCIRLYDEAEFAERPRFTTPEIQRSSLAAVILRMKALGLDSIEQFPFIEPPPGKAIADGYQLLTELGAVDDRNALTPLGRELARLPLDPRIGRMILEARNREALTEVLIIAAALSVQDPRERPAEAQQAADEAHRKFSDERSEFLGWLKLWAHYHAAIAHKKSQRKLWGELRGQYLSPLRLREWHDVHSQLHTLVSEQGWRLNTAEPTYEQIHCALLSGLLGNVGYKGEDDAQYLGARGIRFAIHPSSPLGRKAGRWIMAAELVETTRLYARGVARIEPQWLERVGAHLLKTSLLDPHWEKKPAQVTAFERATLYGLVVYSQRRVDFGRFDPKQAREIFLREALVAGEWDCRWPFFQHNQALIADIERLEHKARRLDVLVDEELIYAFYDQQVPDEVHGGASFDRWYRDAVRAEPKLLFLQRDELMRHEAAGITTETFPNRLKLGALELQLDYTFDPGGARDGVTLQAPLAALNQIPAQRLQWLVPGLLKEKILALLKSLPQRPRSRLVPLPQTAEAFAAQLTTAERFGQGDLLDALRDLVREHTGLALQRTDFKLETLGPHLFFNVQVIDAHGRRIDVGRDIDKLRADHGQASRSAFAELAKLRTGLSPQKNAKAPSEAPAPPRAAPGALAAAPREAPINVPTDALQGLTDWTFDALPELLELRRGAHTLIGFPALVDKGGAVDVEVFDTAEEAARLHRSGLRRLFALQLRDQIKHAEKNLPGFQQAAMQFMSLGTAELLRAQIVDAALDRAFLVEPLPADKPAFAQRLSEGKPRFQLLAAEMARLAAQILDEYAQVQKKLAAFKNQPALHADIRAQLQALLPPRFIAEAPPAQIAHFPRYLQAIGRRLDKFRTDPARDAQLGTQLAPWLTRWQREAASYHGHLPPRLQELRWLLEELRVSLFAQELRTPMPVSLKRLEKVWAQWQG
ncbi:ATP-dependent RNA helicase HrpA [Thiomonas arsenitoxydans]|uniref:ATP-dependent RNA helicase HrpA n=1 Tax=Thiomonas arsenitoxydans (strain DSM 22701 / CIP 110005 / 3As) TaxID=426114 RepID=D6CPV9_THIA3|nr:ATP-dependent RNA helicase HrpA [Thiomonas arsenitoxydans]CAZ88039.1 putative ATP-dependent RNA helicase hrpA [Thiomonas arsenitoxydans]CQR31798.1 ATP-dependent RNA helicase HrpA [Thiomonas arsenitoxydans]CQR32448.1 ATP-dependent RNA helicase HrpA [Thiomonas arsenitoxydans]CQR34678.1 ATP-dependent RNA helicase HrpA [Thiomonas arsenitoxydans]CQR40866.1 ATP-dependent RNA helicase HrpA [Thiomonas arsenitoxydans]